jgi:hypothetical protein
MKGSKQIEGMCENRVLRIIFGPKSKDGTGGGRNFNNEELHNLHSSQNIIRKI